MDVSWCPFAEVILLTKKRVACTQSATWAHYLATNVYASHGKSVPWWQSGLGQLDIPATQTTMETMCKRLLPIARVVSSFSSRQRGGASVEPQVDCYLEADIPVSRRSSSSFCSGLGQVTCQDRESTISRGQWEQTQIQAISRDSIVSLVPSPLDRLSLRRRDKIIYCHDFVL